MADNHSYLILDTIRVPDAKKVCAQHEEYWEPLYLGTSWQHQLELSPIWIRIQPNSPILNLWQTDPSWATSGTVFTFSSEVSEEQAITTLQNNITVTSEDGRLFLFRYYSPYTLSKIAEYGEQREIDGTLGLAEFASLSPLLSTTYSTDSIKNTHSQKSNTLFTTRLVEELLA